MGGGRAQEGTAAPAAAAAAAAAAAGAAGEQAGDGAREGPSSAVEAEAHGRQVMQAIRFVGMQRGLMGFAAGALVGGVVAVVGKRWCSKALSLPKERWAAPMETRKRLASWQFWGTAPLSVGALGSYLASSTGMRQQYEQSQGQLMALHETAKRLQRKEAGLPERTPEEVAFLRRKQAIENAVKREDSAT